MRNPARGTEANPPAPPRAAPGDLPEPGPRNAGGPASPGPGNAGRPAGPAPRNAAEIRPATAGAMPGEPAGPGPRRPAAPGARKTGEPAGRAGRLSGMVATRTSRAAVLAVVCSVVVAGCGGKAGEGGSGQPQVVYFSAAPKGPPDGHEVLDDRAGALRYAAGFAQRDPRARARIAAAAEATDFDREVLVGWTATTGCSAATGAALRVSGHRLRLRISQPEPPQECVAAFRMSVVFRVDRKAMPERPEFG